MAGWDKKTHDDWSSICSLGVHVSVYLAMCDQPDQLFTPAMMIGLNFELFLNYAQLFMVMPWAQNSVLVFFHHSSQILIKSELWSYANYSQLE
jgi:hypothetical protein